MSLLRTEYPLNSKVVKADNFTLQIRDNLDISVMKVTLCACYLFLQEEIFFLSFDSNKLVVCCNVCRVCKLCLSANFYHDVLT